MDHLRFTAYILTPILGPDFVIINGLKRSEMDISRHKKSVAKRVCEKLKSS
jgi:hypothetical protein